jgi:hypothetical protein
LTHDIQRLIEEMRPARMSSDFATRGLGKAAAADQDDGGNLDVVFFGDGLADIAK